MENLYALISGLIASLVAEWTPVIKKWLDEQHPVLRWFVFVLYAALNGAVAYGLKVINGEPFSWEALGMAAYAALLAYLGSQGAYGGIHAIKQASSSRDAIRIRNVKKTKIKVPEDYDANQ